MHYAGFVGSLWDHLVATKKIYDITFYRNSLSFLVKYGGEIGIRTLGTGEGTTDFESVPFGHSGISPTARIITV